MISIPEPCHEDFSAMTPTERGAFCQKCSIDTFDFRNLSSEQINQIVKEKKGEHLCGRFYSHQLDDLNAGFIAWKNQSKKTFQSKFLMACLIVFGLTLFSCETEDKGQLEHINFSELLQNPEVDEKEKTKYINQGFSTQEIDLLEYLQKDKSNQEVECKFIEETAGEIIEFEENEYNSYHIAGGISFVDTEYQVYLKDTIPDTTDSSILPDPIVPISIFEATAFPNPTQTKSTLALEVNEKNQFDILLYDINGRMIQEIYSGELNEGRQQFEVNLTGQQTGMYIVNVISKQQKETLKIQKLN
ncbi:MAG: T9SS type A sorting domain-containing protein [Crocinitomicaceae bacterium]